jgi:hypothetical protein
MGLYALPFIIAMGHKPANLSPYPVFQPIANSPAKNGVAPYLKSRIWEQMH